MKARPQAKRQRRKEKEVPRALRSRRDEKQQQIPRGPAGGTARDDKSTRRKPEGPPAKQSNRVLYLYAISQVDGSRTAAIGGSATAISSEGIDGAAPVEALSCDGFVCWVSRVSREDFADNLTVRMEDLTWLASAGLRHQRVVAEIAGKATVLPARFGTVFFSDESLAQHLKERGRELRKAFAKVSDADEWGVKVFQVAKPKISKQAAPASGAEYLKRKAEVLRPRRSTVLDEPVRELITALQKLAVAASPGGKASTGQPGLLWHGAFLVRRKDRRKLDSLLTKHARQWRDRWRIEWSGPWPPYSFVGEHVR